MVYCSRGSGGIVFRVWESQGLREVLVNEGDFGGGGIGSGVE